MAIPVSPPDRPMNLENDPYGDDNPYEVLDVPRDADRARIKAAYRALQKRAKRGDATWMKAQVANEALTKPKKRLLVDLFVIDEKKRYAEIVKRYGEISFEAVPKDLTPLLLRATDLEWGDLAADFAVPVSPRIVFSRLQATLPDSDEATVPFGSSPR